MGGDLDRFVQFAGDQGNAVQKLVTSLGAKYFLKAHQGIRISAGIPSVIHPIVLPLQRCLPDSRKGCQCNEQ